ncbi:hypothetical protein VP1G_00950 [Cytospora mali]|uniref:Meiotically up-regulated gene 190 protein n=1 Tax=Cytospora mali TaxID=578113 RepID=A0A194UPC4_CYTMA|nr:hypothetical protein VP1G_00950 [Valsa mali var. pyri (nom. inval.)]
MSGQQENFEEESQRRSYTKPHSGKHPIPTIQGYREHKRDIQDQQQQQAQAAQEGPEDASKTKRAFGSVKAIFKGEDEPQSRHEPYPSANHHYLISPPDQSQHGQETGPLDEQQVDSQKSATEHVVSASDPKQKRKAMKKAKRTGGREVTDPVTHLPIVINDQTDKDMNMVPENEPEPGEHHTTATGPQGAAKSDAELEKEKDMVQRGFNGMQRLFPPPEFDDLKKELGAAYQTTVRAGLTVIGVAAAGPFVISSLQGRICPHWSTVLGVLGFLSVTLGTAWGMGKWMSKKVDEIVDDETWESSRREEQAILDSDTELPESVQWLNSFMAAIWPLINPDLFSSLIDTIEDVMQASLPKAIKMVSVDDMGQGNQSLRILGIRWLPTGAASRSVGPGGKLEDPEKSKDSDRTDSEEAQARNGDDNPADYEEHEGEDEKDTKKEKEKGKQDEQSEEAIREGMEAEEGDFVNLELALAYRSRASGRSIRAKAKNAHLFLKFYSFGGVALPVWVEVRGFVAKVRLRLQLTPDPPFVSLCTLTFLGQPRASMSCVPLSKHGLNLMDVPMISSFVQSAIDAALAEYVAPKSLTLNLKDMLMGDDFKKDTASQGVVFIFIKRAGGFKMGDGGIGKLQGASDSYVTVSWGKFGKTFASTRVIESTQNPEWHEYASILVTPEELNAEERLRLQLWDSDKYTADDDLGRVEVDLKEIMKSPESHNRMQDREDRFTGQDPDEKMAGSIQWSVGYFAKVRITEQELQQQTVDENIRTKEQLKKHVSELSANKLREAGKASKDTELHQQHVQDYAEIENDMIISAPPSQEFISGILSVQIHNITGLEIQKLQKQDNGDGETDGEETETDDDMPDSYCSIILNHKTVYRSRTKPKNSKPFFNAGTERFIKDWRNTEIIVSVRDSREREEDPLIGIVYLPLAKAFANRSQVMDTYPLVGGIGYGRARISMVWRSVEMKLPPSLVGWDYGTLEIRGAVRAKGQLPDKPLKSRLKIRTDLGKVKMYTGDSQGVWALKKGRDSNGSAFLPVCKRYASALVVEFRESSIGPDRSPAFAVMWLRDLVDEESAKRTLKVWKGGKDRLARAQSNCEYNGMEDGEQPLGEIELDVKFWRGLSGYHKRFAAGSKKGTMRMVMECLDTITDENLAKDDDDQDNGLDTDEDDSDESSQESKSGDKEARKKLKAPKKILRNPVEGTASTAASILAPGHNDADDGSRGLRNQLRDYKDHHKQLHRKHRGIMQWRAAREVDHLGSKLSDLKGDVSQIFKHSEKDVGVETEV